MLMYTFGICFSMMSTWLKVQHWYYLISIYFGTWGIWWLRHLVHGRDISWVIWHLFGMLVDAHGWDIGRCTCWNVDRGIWLIHSMDHILWHIVWCWCTWLMYMGVVHGGHTFWYRMYLVDIFLMILYFIVDIYFASWCLVWHEFDAWIGPSIVIW